MLKGLNSEEKVKLGLFTVLSVALVGGLLWMAGISPVKGQPTSPAPQATITSVTSSPAVQIVAANPSRHAIQICAAAGSTVTVLPATGPTGAVVTPVAGTGIQIAVNTCFVPPALITFSGTSWGGGSAWNAIAASTTTPVTVLEW